MSKLSKAVAKKRETNSLRLNEAVTNFMGGTSYTINPLDTLKMVTASSIFGEPSYYRDANKGKPRSATMYKEDSILHGFTILGEEFESKTTEEIMESVIDAALEYDFGATLAWAVTLRRDFFMRLNPQVIMVRASIHPGRKKYTEENPGKFAEINDQVMLRPDDPMSQMSYYLYNNEGKKNNIPSVLKRSWAKELSGFSKKMINKYKNHEIGMINAVRLCHAHSEELGELMSTGTVLVPEEEKTWEQFKSEGKDWKWILENCNLGHMALLRNIRGVFSEIDDADLCKWYMEKLINGVEHGKQFPFRYYSAIKAVTGSKCNHKPMILDALERCVDESMKNYPKLKGKTMCLSDNSGSAWGSFNSEYGTVTVAEIDNLSAAITAACSDEGYVGVFGDKLKTFPIVQRYGIMNQTAKLSECGQRDVGHATEGGIWKFFRDAIKNKEHWDNIFIYSDQQAGHGGLYGTSEDKTEYLRGGFNVHSGMINVFKLVQEYRKTVNPKVNVFSVQTAGYDNVVIPEMAYRCGILYGWTGREAQFAKEYTYIWDQIEDRNEQ